MRYKTISLRRRHMIIASLAGAAAPGTIFAGQCGVTPRNMAAITELPTEFSTTGGEHKLVVSGRILRPDCKPLAGATIEMWQSDPNTDRASATTDADGRFFTTMAPGAYPGRPRPIHYRVSHEEHGTLVKRLDLARERGVSDGLVSRLQRDETGAWRTTFGLTVV